MILMPSEPHNPNPTAIKASIWRLAEKAALEIILHLKPKVASEQTRKLIVEYLQKLIRGSVNIEIFPFGSFPLKTYFPNGDIDLTAIGNPSSDDELAFDVRDLLEREGHNQDSEFKVKDVQYIGAEVDHFIGRDHLFKRSIMLIKAWCSYENCIIGSHQGLLSTYALEMLILYIFHFFRSSFDGPLAVLYRFLYYFDQFDWDKYYITLQGPVFISSLHELSMLEVDNDGGDLLLTDEFLRSCVDFFSVPMRISDDKFQTFTRKYVNIVDPLRESNNLGRSVHLCGFVQICSSLKCGARILGSLLLQPTKCIGDNVNEFFANTLHLHGGSESPDMQDLAPRSARNALVGSSGLELMQTVGKLEKKKADELSSESLTSKACSDLNKELKNIRISGLDECEGIVAPQKSPSHKHQNITSGEVNSISSERLAGDAKDLPTSSTSVLRRMTESHKTSSPTKDDGILDFRNPYHALQLFLNSQSQARKDSILEQINSTSLGPSSDVLSTLALSSDEEIITSMQPDFCKADSSSSNTGSVGISGDGNIGNCINEPSTLIDELSDLSGDYDMHLNNLNYAVWCHEVIKNAQSIPMYQLPPNSYYGYGMDAWTQGSVLIDPSSPGPLFPPTAYYSLNPPSIYSSYSSEDVPKARGTGTFFTNMNYQVYRERHSPGRVTNAASLNRPPRPPNNLKADALKDSSSLEKESHEPAIQTQPMFNRNGGGKLPARLDVPNPSSRLPFKESPNASRITSRLNYGKLKFGSVDPVSVEGRAKEHGRSSDFPISHSHGSGFTSSASSSRRPAMNSDRERRSQSYQMKDEDFPPLSG